MTIFSEDLIQRTIKYFAEKHDHQIDEEKASEYLENMAGLYLAFSKMDGHLDCGLNSEKVPE